MKSKIRFILPRLLVVTAILGVVTLIIGVLFKLMLLASVLFGVGALVAAKIRKRKLAAQQYQQAAFAQHPMFAVYNQYQSAIIPVQHTFQGNKKTIVPIY